MNALVVYESVYGNTRAVADAVAEGLGGAAVLPVHEAVARAAQADLLVVGGPTHMHGLATTRSREMAAAAAHEDGALTLDPSATKEPGLRKWLHELDDNGGAQAAAFDTRLDRSQLLTGLASRGIAKRLRRHGYEVLGTESFLVEDSEGPLEDGELDRARAWGAQLAASVGSAATPLEAGA
jgi:Flavodoxin domain